MLVKIHRSDNKILLAVCDSELIGKKFEEGKRQLDLSSSFYSGNEKTNEEIIKSMHGADIINLVGKKAVELAIKEGIVSEKHVIKIKNIPHAQVVF